MTPDTDRQEVTLIGPTEYRVDLTDEQLQTVRNSDFPIGEIPKPKEWEPVGTAEDWTIITADGGDENRSVDTGSSHSGGSGDV